MFYNAVSPFQFVNDFRVQQGSVAMMSQSNYERTAPRLEMIIGPWHHDEFGNLTREIKARD